MAKEKETTRTDSEIKAELDKAIQKRIATAANEINETCKKHRVLLSVTPNSRFVPNSDGTFVQLFGATINLVPAKDEVPNV